MNAHTLIGTNQVIALEVKLTVMPQKLQALEARQALAVKQTPAASAAAARTHRGKRSVTTTKGAVGKQAKSALTPFSARPFCWCHGPWDGLR